MSATSLQPLLKRKNEIPTNEKDIAFILQRPRHLTNFFDSLSDNVVATNDTFII